MAIYSPAAVRCSAISMLAVSSAVSILLAGCSGGGGTSTASASAQSMSGTVAVGAPMVNATVTLMDANGTTRSVAVAADGSYSGIETSGLTAPFRVQACGIVDGAYTCYYSVVQGGSTANVTPLTNATVALALNGDASGLFSGHAAPDSATLAAKKLALQTALGPVLAAAGLSASTDFESQHFDANRTGMDKVLDAVKISTGSDTGNAFVQVEGRVGAGNVYLNSAGASAGSLGSGNVAANMAVDLTGISAIFSAMSNAVAQSSAGACTTAMRGANIFDANFSLQINNSGPTLDATSAPGAMCTLVDTAGLLGGRVANPILRECDFSQADKVCLVGFDVVKGDTVLDGAELAVILPSGGSTWKLKGKESDYEIHVSAAVQRTMRIDVPNATKHYYRALSFDIKSTVNGTPNAVKFARVYQHDSSGTGWDPTPIAELSDSGCTSSPNLTMAGSSCGSTWLALDSNSVGSLTDGDALIDAFYRRGREVKIELYSDNAHSVLVTTVVKHVDGVPPKAADLDGLPWLEIDANTKAALIAYDSGSSPSSFTTTWATNRAVFAKDITVCDSTNCANKVHDNVDAPSASSITQNLGTLTLTASGIKEISLYGRNREGMGVASNYVSCPSNDGSCPAP